MLHFIAEKFQAGGFFMYPILFCSFYVIALAAERFKTLSAAASINKDEFLHHVQSQILQGNLEKAIAASSQIKNPLTNIVRAGLVAVSNQQDDEQVQTAMDAVALREIPRLEKGIPMLAMLSNLCTLLGLLGTISGLIGAFGAVANVSPAEKASLLSHAISEAMNCTAFGLLVAIPSLFVYGILSGKSQRVVDEIHESSVATLNFILTNRQKLNK